MTYGHLQADCLYTGISSGPNARCRVWEAFTFTFFTYPIGNSAHNDRKSRRRRIKKQRRYERLASLYTKGRAARGRPSQDTRCATCREFESLGHVLRTCSKTWSVRTLRFLSYCVGLPLQRHCIVSLLKAKFHYISWFGAAS